MKASRWVHLLAGVAVCLSLGLTLGRRATAETPGQDRVPKGTVAFFSFDDTGGNCPAGWVSATQVQGRLVVAVSQPPDVGVMVGTPLSDQEDRTHTHQYDSVVNLPSRNVAGSNGGNNQGASAGDHPLTGTTQGASSGLPFVQLLVCEKS